MFHDLKLIPELDSLNRKCLFVRQYLQPVSVLDALITSVISLKKSK